MQPRIPESTLREIRRVEDGICAAAERLVQRRLAKRAVELLNRFQAKVRTPVSFVTCNGDFWLSDGVVEQGRYKVLCDTLDDVANPSCPGSDRSRPEFRAKEDRYMRHFPELVELWWIAYECDALVTRTGLPELNPTVKPRRTKGS